MSEKAISAAEHHFPTSGRAPRASATRKPWAGGFRPSGASAAIYAHLRAEILSLDRLPGEPLSENELARSHGVSRTPVREAILRLASEGLVEIFPQSGTFVARIPLDALPEAIAIRKSLEETAARLAAKTAKRSQILALRATLERQREADRAGDRGAFHRADDAFHATVAEIAGYPGIWTMVQQVKIQVDRFRRLTLPQEGRTARVVKEHEAIVAAIDAGDPRRAARAVATHLDGLLADIPDIQQHHLGFFAGGP